MRDAAGKTYKLPAGKQELGPGLKLKLAASTKALPAPLVFSPGTAPLALGNRAYRGTLRVTGGKAVRVVNVVGLESYLWGVVPSEMPDTWPAEALKSQAIVARTYALTHMLGGGDFDVYPDTRSQVYGGMAAESDSAHEAVDGTAGEVVLYKGELAQTFFFSSSGGRTANVQDVWNGSKPTPYLVSVPDPYDTLSPYHDWGPLKMSALRLGKRLGSRGALLDVRTDTAADGRVRSLTLIGTKGNRTVSGSSVRAALGLRSTWFTMGTLSLTQPGRSLEYGTQTRLVGLARGIPQVTLESRPVRRPVEDARRAEVARRPGGCDALAEGDDRLPHLLGDRAQRRGAPVGGALGAADRLERPDRGHRARQAAAARRARPGAAAGRATARGRPSRRRTSPRTARSRRRSTSRRAATARAWSRARASRPASRRC